MLCYPLEEESQSEGAMGEDQKVRQEHITVDILIEKFVAENERRKKTLLPQSEFFNPLAHGSCMASY